MIKRIKNPKYEATEIENGDRYWLSRKFDDLRHGRSRTVLVTLEKAGPWKTETESILPWNMSIEDKNISQTWKLSLLQINGEDKLVFERFSKYPQGMKEETFNLAYLPKWVVEEINCFRSEIKERIVGEELLAFLTSLITKIEQEKTEAKAGLSAKVEELEIGGLYHILSTTRGDSRGSFREVARFPEIELLTGYDFIGKQVNHSLSSYGTLRGFHVEPWAKLVTVISGLAVCYLIDCRSKSATFGKISKVYLGFGTTPDGEEIKGGALFIEPGIGNSLLTLSEKLDYNYVVDDLWRPDTALYAVNPMDPKLAVPWESYVPADKIIRSERDVNSPSFEEFAEKTKSM